MKRRFGLCGIETDRTERGYTAEDYERLAAALGDSAGKHGGQING
jgi:hypothetical protein